MTGQLSYCAGVAAEQQVSTRYRDRGAEIVAMRWRGRGGELDIIVREGATTVFVEVKKSRSHTQAAHRLSQRQIARLYDAAGEYLGGQPGGLNSTARFDVALVDGMGRIEIIENALCA